MRTAFKGIIFSVSWLIPSVLGTICLVAFGLDLGTGAVGYLACFIASLGAMTLVFLVVSKTDDEENVSYLGKFILVSVEISGILVFLIRFMNHPLVDIFWMFYLVPSFLVGYLYGLDAKIAAKKKG